VYGDNFEAVLVNGELRSRYSCVSPGDSIQFYLKEIKPPKSILAQQLELRVQLRAARQSASDLKRLSDDAERTAFELDYKYTTFCRKNDLVKTELV
jgi:hypothetical protein